MPSPKYNLRSAKCRKNLCNCESMSKYNPYVKLEKLKILDNYNESSPPLQYTNGRITMKIDGKTGGKFNWTPVKCFKAFSVILAVSMTFYGAAVYLGYIDGSVFSDLMDKLMSICGRQKISKCLIVNEEEYEKAVAKHVLRCIKALEETPCAWESCSSRASPKASDSSAAVLSETEQCPVDPGNSINTTDDFFFSSNPLTDYALEAKGARIMSTFDTVPYSVIFLKFFNLEIEVNSIYFQKYVYANGPSSVLKPWTKPGDCWAFKGSYGQIQIELSESVVVSGISIDHIRNSSLPRTSLNSAPKKFSIRGFPVHGNGSSEGLYMGSYDYDIDGPSMQTFPVSQRTEIPLKSIKVTFETNHGSPGYTCVYKIRVHGFGK